MDPKPNQFQQQEPMISEPELQQSDQISQRPNKKLWLFVIIGLIIAGGAFGFWLWQKQDRSSGEQIVYENNKYGFKFTYPKDWTIGGPPLGEGSDYSDDLIQFRGDGCVLSFVETGGRGLGPEWRVEDKDVEISGRRFNSRHIYRNDSLQQINIFDFPSVSSNHTLEFTVTEGDKLSDKCLSIYNEILSTVEIIDPTAGWQTYRNEEYDFELKYPEDFSYHESYPEFVNFDKKEMISAQCGSGIGYPRCGINLDGVLKRIDYPDLNEAVEIIPLGPNDKLSETKKVLLGNNYFTKAKRSSSLDMDDPFYSSVLFYFLDDKELIYIFLVVDDYETIADQILSTFRFVE